MFSSEHMTHWVAVISVCISYADTRLHCQTTDTRIVISRGVSVYWPAAFAGTHCAY